MPYNTLETSIEDGRPFHLYRFTLGSTVWRYTSADQDQLIDSYTWKAVAIEDSGVSQTGEISSDALSITASWTIGPAQVYMSAPPSEPIIVERLGMHEGIAVPVVNYVGEILQVNFPTPGQVTISAHTLSATMRRSGLRLGWQRTCPYALYDPTTCKVNPSNHGIIARIESVDGFNLVLSNLENDRNYQGGYFEWTHPTRGVQRTAIASFTNTGTAPVTTQSTVSIVTPGSHSVVIPAGTVSYSWSMSGGGGGGSGGASGENYYVRDEESGEIIYIPKQEGVNGFPGAPGVVVTGNQSAPTVGATLSVVIGAGGTGGAAGQQNVPFEPGASGSNGAATTVVGDSLSLSAAGGGGATSSAAGSGSGTGAPGGSAGLAENRGMNYEIFNQPAIPATAGGNGGNGYLTLIFSRTNVAADVGSIVAFGDTSDLSPGMNVIVYPGCQRTVAACQSFGNLNNYGGFELMPGKSPFDGTPFF